MLSPQAHAERRVVRRIGNGLLFPLPSHDCAHHRMGAVGIGRDWAFNEELVAFEPQVMQLLATRHSLIPGNIHFRDEFVAINPGGLIP